MDIDYVYRKTSNTSRVSNTSRGFRSLVLIQAGSPIQAGSCLGAWVTPWCHLVIPYDAVSDVIIA